MKNVHTFSLSWPILMIFVANIMLSHVQMHTMMTRSVLALTIRVKMAKKTWKTLGENISSSLEMENGCNFCPNWPNLMIFLAKLVKPYVLIRFMMTRTSYIFIQTGKIGFRGYYSMTTIGAQYYNLPGALGDTKSSTKLNFFGICGILSSNWTRKCLWTKEN